MKQLGTLSKEEKPAAGKAINAAKVELEAALRFAPRRTRTQSRAAQGTDRFHFARTPPRARQTASAHAGDRRHRAQLSAKSVSSSPTGQRLRMNIIASTRSTRPPTIPRATRKTLFIWELMPTTQNSKLKTQNFFYAPTLPPSKSA